MKKQFKHVLSLALSALMAASAGTISFSASAASEDDLGKVRVVVKNETYSTEDGAAWDGVLVDKWVSLDSDSTLFGIVADTLEKNGCTQTGCETGYVTELGGLASSSSGYWAMLINDWSANQGGSYYNVADGTLEAGDEIAFEYSAEGWGTDIGIDCSSSDTSLESISFDGAALQNKFEPSVSDYTLVIGTQTADVTVTPTAANRSFQVKTYKNTYAPTDSSASYKRSESISLEDGDKIIVGVGGSSWEASVYLSEGETYEGSTYTFTVKYVPEFGLASEKVESTAAYLSTLDTTVGSIGGEWKVLGLAGADKLTDEAAEAYCNSVEEYVAGIGSAQLDASKSTENSRIIIALTAVGKNAADFASYDLTAPLADFDYITKQGLNGAVYALIALDTAGYQIPKTDAQNVTTRDKLVSYILENQVTGGGWTYYGDTADSDMTPMAIQALAPYYNTNNEVKSAVDNALDVLSNMQYDDGTFGSYGSNSCSTAQVLAALTSLNIDPTADERFIKNGSNLIGALLSFSVDDGFQSGYGEAVYDQMSTEQSFYALASYLRVNSGKTSLYDMTEDVAAMYEVGDVNMNGTVNIIDVTFVQKYIAQIDVISDAQCIIANALEDEAVNISDATQIQKIIAKIV